MKLRQTAFFKQMVAVIVGTIFAVSSYAFVSIPVVLASTGSITHLS